MNVAGQPLHSPGKDAFEHAKELQAAGRWDEAVTAYRRVIAEDPRAIKAWNNLGIVLEEQGALPQAVECYRKALEIDASHAILHYNLAHAMHGLGRVVEAVGHYLTAIELDPRAVAAQLNLGLIMVEQEDWAAAESAFRAVLEIDPNAVRAHHCLGELLFDQRRVEEALPFYQRAAELDPDDAEYPFNLGKCLRTMNRLDEALHALQRSLELNPDSAVAREHLVGVLLDLGRREDAADLCRQRLAEHPDDAIARQRLAAITGQDIPSRAPDRYVQRLFDLFAETFDATLSDLQYGGPRQVAALLRQHVSAPARQFDILDAGCGTGLCGVLLREYARRLIGVDLSREMLRHARQRGVYDDLFQEELTHHLQHHEAAYDGIVAADTLIYFGSLDELFAAAALALRPGAWWIFTLEQGDACERGWSLQTNGRYCHSETYLRRTLDQQGLVLEQLNVEAVRHEASRPVANWLVAARRP